MECLSLFGFLPDDQALRYLASSLDWIDPQSFLQTAHERLTAVDVGPVTQAWQAMPDAADLKDQLARNPLLQLAIPPGAPWDLGVVEVDRLCIYQCEIHLDRVERILSWLPASPGPEDVREACLPLRRHWDVQLRWIEQRPDGLIGTVSMISDDHNLRLTTTGDGVFNGQKGVFFCVSNGSPYVTVAQLGDRLILTNGYHRLFALRQRGITSVPCLIRPVSSLAEAGGMQPGFLPADIVLSARPPQFGHFSLGGATQLRRRKLGKLVRISVTETPIPVDFEIPAHERLKLEAELAQVDALARAQGSEDGIEGVA